jgi:BirA family transcriptional regulator, biotin operon repressor / biotin---[acetyl-CoA-carboxylase] ligase
MSFGTPHRHYRRTDSTNTRARELAAAGAPHGTVVTAAEQSEGRGRQGRTWTAPAGKALLYSAIVRPLDERHLVLPLAAPLAVCEAAEALEPGLECAVKWPNDVWVEERKLAGVLIEARPQDGWAVVGVGLNLMIEPHEFPPELRDSAVSLATALPNHSAVPSAHQVGIRNSAKRELDRCLARWVAEDAATVLAAWRGRDALRGREVAWDGGSGLADGVDDRGFLLVLTPGGDRIAVGAGEVHLRL